MQPTDNYKWSHVPPSLRWPPLEELLSCEVFHLLLNHNDDKGRIKHIFNKDIKKYNLNKGQKQSKPCMDPAPWVKPPSIITKVPSSEDYCASNTSHVWKRHERKCFHFLFSSSLIQGAWVNHLGKLLSILDKGILHCPSDKINFALQSASTPGKLSTWLQLTNTGILPSLWQEPAKASKMVAGTAPAGFTLNYSKPPLVSHTGSTNYVVFPGKVYKSPLEIKAL